LLTSTYPIYTCKGKQIHDSRSIYCPNTCLDLETKRPNGFMDYYFQVPTSEQHHNFEEGTKRYIHVIGSMKRQQFVRDRLFYFSYIHLTLDAYHLSPVRIISEITTLCYTWKCIMDWPNYATSVSNAMLHKPPSVGVINTNWYQLTFSMLSIRSSKNVEISHRILFRSSNVPGWTHAIVISLLIKIHGSRRVWLFDRWFLLPLDTLSHLRCT
jgi:hypothetical protein